MKKALVAVSLATAAIAGLPTYAAAQSAPAASPHTFSGNLSLVSEYRYRGINQTNGKPAVQGGFDYSHASGFYAGTWWTNVSWLSDAGASNSVETDWYAGFKGSAGDFGYDIGVLHYYYPGRYPSGFTSPNTTELYVAGTWKMLTLKYSHSVSNLFGVVDSKGAGYIDLSGNFELGSGFVLGAHVGHQIIPSGSVDGIQVRSRRDCSYTDWKLGVSKEIVGLTVGLAYIDTDAKGGEGQCYRNAYNKDLGKGTVVLSVSKTF
ncbi:MAG: TorF family putative porin [Burkholderiaceae bacterium]